MNAEAAMQHLVGSLQVSYEIAATLGNLNCPGLALPLAIWLDDAGLGSREKQPFRTWAPRLRGLDANSFGQLIAGAERPEVVTTFLDCIYGRKCVRISCRFTITRRRGVSISAGTVVELLTEEGTRFYGEPNKNKFWRFSWVSSLLVHLNSPM
jgi:hypothetical protein